MLEKHINDTSHNIQLLQNVDSENKHAILLFRQIGV
jgi:hypothetical protein